MWKLYRDEMEHVATPWTGGAGVPGKRTLSQGLAPRPTLFRVAAAGPARDGNGVAEGAEDAVDRAAGGSGAPLRADLRERFEASLGADLSGVRVHTGDGSAHAAAAVGARAYTVGNDIHFGAGHYRPDDPFGLHLIAHEVAHTQQQQGGAARRQHKLEVSTPGDHAEVEADRAADAMVMGAPAVIGSAAMVLARAPDTGDHAGKGSMTASTKGVKFAGEYKWTMPWKIPVGEWGVIEFTIAPSGQSEITWWKDAPVSGGVTVGIGGSSKKGVQGESNGEVVVKGIAITDKAIAEALAKKNGASLKSKLAITEVVPKYDVPKIAHGIGAKTVDLAVGVTLQLKHAGGDSTSVSFNLSTRGHGDGKPTDSGPQIALNHEFALDPVPQEIIPGVTIKGDLKAKVEGKLKIAWANVQKMVAKEVAKRAAKQAAEEAAEKTAQKTAEQAAEKTAEEAAKKAAQGGVAEGGGATAETGLAALDGAALVEIGAFAAIGVSVAAEFAILAGQITEIEQMVARGNSMIASYVAGGLTGLYCAGGAVTNPGMFTKGLVAHQGKFNAMVSRMVALPSSVKAGLTAAEVTVVLMKACQGKRDELAKKIDAAIRPQVAQELAQLTYSNQRDDWWEMKSDARRSAESVKNQLSPTKEGPVLDDAAVDRKVEIQKEHDTEEWVKRQERLDKKVRM